MIRDEADLGLRELQTKRRKEQIISASITVLAAGGYSEYSMRRVAGEAGLRLNTVQHHFGDLKALLLATVRARIGEFAQRYRNLALNEDLPALERLEALMDDTFAEMRNEALGAFMMEVWTLAGHDEDVAAMLRDLYTNYRASIAQMVQQAAPTLSATEVNIYATMIGGWLEGMVPFDRYGGENKPTLSAVAIRIKTTVLSLFGTLTPQPTKARKSR